eukprot:2946386-Amphidinium_carterae.1
MACLTSSGVNTNVSGWSGWTSAKSAKRWVRLNLSVKLRTGLGDAEKCFFQCWSHASATFCLSLTIEPVESMSLDPL